MRLANIIKRGTFLRAREMGISLPENPSLEDFRREAFRIAQLAKELQNSKPGGFYPKEHWDKISKAIQKLEDTQISK